MTRRRRRSNGEPFAVHELYDSDRHVAIVRYDGDPDVFTALAWAHLIDAHIPGAAAIDPPDPRLYRCNPDRAGDGEWTLGQPDKPGPGVFTGALITLARNPRRARGPRADTTCKSCTAQAGERHESWCWNGRVIDLPVFAATLAALRPRAIRA